MNTFCSFRVRSFSSISFDFHSMVSGERKQACIKRLEKIKPLLPVQGELRKTSAVLIPIVNIEVKCVNFELMIYICSTPTLYEYEFIKSLSLICGPMCTWTFFLHNAFYTNLSWIVKKMLKNRTLGPHGKPFMGNEMNEIKTFVWIMVAAELS